MLLFGLLSACAVEDAIDLELIPDPNINDEQAIVSRVSNLLTTVDSEDGLYPPGSEHTEGAVQLVNVDTDDALEIVATIPVNDRLPRVRLERGSISDAPLDIRIQGEDDSGTVAEGRVRGVRFGQEIVRLRVPFNIRPEQLPPRLTEVYPPDGSPVQGCDLSLIILFFSKPVDPSTLFEEGAVQINDEAPASIRAPSSGLSAEIVPPCNP